jgi:hypothetical protein
MVTAAKGAPALRSVTVGLPGGVAIASRRWPRGIRAKLDGRALPIRTLSAKGGSLAFTLDGKGRTLSVDVAGPLLQVARRLLAQPAKGHRAPAVTFVVTVKDAAGASTTLRVTVSAS